VDADILLVGLGPVGATLANLLGRHGVTVLAIDQAAAIVPKPRAIALDHGALRILQLAGVQPGDFAAVPIPRVTYHSPLFGPLARLDTSTLQDGHPGLVTCHQPELEAALRSRLQRWPGVRVQFATALETFASQRTHVTAILKTAAGARTGVRARYLVGADGANSFVRGALGLEFRIERIAVYRLQARTASAYSRGRCFLAGDAAHSAPPLAGQGFVAGLRDAANLAWKLAWVVQGRAGAAILASYDQERRPHARKVIRRARLLGALVMPPNRAVAFAVHAAIRLARAVPAGRALFDALMIEPPATLGRGLFRPGRQPRLLAGSPLPQGWVRHAGKVSLSDEVLGSHWALIGIGVDPATGVPHELLQRWHALGGRNWHWLPRAQVPAPAGVSRGVQALDDSLHVKLPAGWVALVRPDRYVYAEAPLEQAPALLRQVLSDLQGAAGATDPRAAQAPEPQRKAA
jgi:2-polyprenyl-6-methoxyphenol hydroxylase-like FAD-dependent oxidoreductase